MQRQLYSAFRINRNVYCVTAGFLEVVSAFRENHRGVIFALSSSGISHLLNLNYQRDLHTFLLYSFYASTFWADRLAIMSELQCWYVSSRLLFSLQSQLTNLPTGQLINPQPKNKPSYRSTRRSMMNKSINQQIVHRTSTWELELFVCFISDDNVHAVKTFDVAILT